MSKVRILFIKRYEDKYKEPKFFWFDVKEKDAYDDTLQEMFLEGLKKERLQKKGNFLMLVHFPNTMVILELKNVEKIRKYDNFFSSGKPIYWINNKEFNIINEVRKKEMIK